MGYNLSDTLQPLTSVGIEPTCLHMPPGLVTRPALTVSLSECGLCAHGATLVNHMDILPLCSHHGFVRPASIVSVGCSFLWCARIKRLPTMRWVQRQSCVCGLGPGFWTQEGRFGSGTWHWTPKVTEPIPIMFLSISIIESGSAEVLKGAAYFEPSSLSSSLRTPGAYGVQAGWGAVDCGHK